MSDDAPITDLGKMAACVTDESPNRTTRRLFVYSTMLIALVVAVSLSVFGKTDNQNIKAVVDSMNTYLLTMGPVYLIGHSIDRSEVLTKLGESFERK